MPGIASSIRNEVRATARTASLGIVGTLLVLVGLAFLTLALWIYLVTIGSAQVAALVIGGLYCAAGFILLAIAASGSRSRATDVPRAAADSPGDRYEPFVRVAEGFAVGLQAGRAARKPN